MVDTALFFQILVDPEHGLRQTHDGVALLEIDLAFEKEDAFALVLPGYDIIGVDQDGPSVAGNIAAPVQGILGEQSQGDDGAGQQSERNQGRPKPSLAQSHAHGASCAESPRYRSTTDAAALYAPIAAKKAKVSSGGL